MAEYIINIVDTHSHGKRVRPAKLTVESGDWVEWRNLLKEEVNLHLDRGDQIFHGYPNNTMKIGAHEIQIPPNQVARYPVVAHPLHGNHSYQVIGLRTREYANGDSDPRIDVL